MTDLTFEKQDTSMNRTYSSARNIVTLLPVILMTLHASSSFPLSAADQSDDSSKLTIDRIFDANEFELKNFSARWIEGTSAFTTLVEVDTLEKRKNIELYDCLTGQSETIVAAQELLPPGEVEPLKIDGYELSKDRTKVLIFTNSQRVWRKNSKGDYWLFDCKTRVMSRLGRDHELATMMFAKFSPDAQYVAYVQNRNVYLEDLSDHSTRCLTTTESDHIINGATDWVYEEEFQIQAGFRWSPDGKQIAFWQFDTSDVDQFPLVNNIDSLYPTVKWFAYPKVGQRNSACRIGVVTCESAATTWVDVPGNARDYYLPRFEWAANSQELLIQQLNRLQNINQLYLADTYTGKCQPVLKEEDSAWVDVHDELFWLEGGKQFTWLSERDGWRHVYLVSRDTADIRLVTPGDYDVISLLKVDEENGCFYFIASPGDATQRFLYRGTLAGGDIVKLTPDNQRGVHDYSFSEDSTWAIHTSSNSDFPGKTELIRIPEHNSVKVLEENQAIVESVSKLAKNPVEFFRADIGNEIQLDAWCITPPNFDPHGSYPLLVYVYGEPAGSTVVDQWGKSSHLWHLMLAQQGYVVMSFDNRGTKVPKGREWRKCIYKKIGILPPKEQAAAVQSVLKTRPYLDPKRVGIWGWSGGGSSSLQAIFKYPEIYSTAIAIAAVPDQRYYDSIYQERYMGLPETNPDAFKEGSPINFVENLKGNLLLIHGTADDNCHFQTTEILIDKLIEHDKQFSLMTYPNRTHAVKERKNTERHLRELMTRYLLQNLPPHSKF